MPWLLLLLPLPLCCCLPCSGEQAEAIEKEGIRPDVFLLINVPDALLIDRVVGRRSDPGAPALCLGMSACPALAWPGLRDDWLPACLPALACLPGWPACWACWLALSLPAEPLQRPLPSFLATPPCASSAS